MDETNVTSDFLNEITGHFSYVLDLGGLNNFSDMNISFHINNTELNYNGTNSTFSTVDWRATYKPLLDYLLMMILIVVMLSMGCEITWPNLFHHVKKPIGLCIGVFSQFGIMPLSAFCILLATGIEGLHATGVLIISCCPGGVLSNTFTYFCEGNLPLSVAMTCTSTVIAMGMMPLNIWLYGRRFESEDLIIPYEKMAMSLITVTSPVVFGMLIKWKFPRVASVMTKLGGYCAILIMFVCIGMEIALFPNMFVGVSFSLYFVILALPAIGVTLGYTLAAILKQSKPIRKTIGIECGVQNVPVALTIIALSFPMEVQEDLVLLPWMYGFAMMSSCTVICLTYHFSKKFTKKPDSNANGDIKIKEVEDPLLGDIGSKNETKIVIRPAALKNGHPVFDAKPYVFESEENTKDDKTNTSV